MKSSPASPIEWRAPLPAPPDPLFAAELPTPFGPAVVAGTGAGLTHVRLREGLGTFIEEARIAWGVTVFADDVPLREAITAIMAYLDGIPGPIRTAVQPVGLTGFDRTVHEALARIPWGETRTYGDIALSIGRPHAARAVGNACGRNPVALVVPCHRVVAVNGLGGFGWGGLAIKRRLLALEGIRVPG